MLLPVLFRLNGSKPGTLPYPLAPMKPEFLASDDPSLPISYLMLAEDFLRGYGSASMSSISELLSVLAFDMSRAVFLANSVLLMSLSLKNRLEMLDYLSSSGSWQAESLPKALFVADSECLKVDYLADATDDCFFCSASVP